MFDMNNLAIPNLVWVDRDGLFIESNVGLSTFSYVIYKGIRGDRFQLTIWFLGKGGIKEKRVINDFQSLEEAKLFAEEDYLDNIYKIFGVDRKIYKLSFSVESQFNFSRSPTR